MKTSYDKHYQKENLFGAPYDELVVFFKNHEPKGNVLDLGCGQGRDSIELAKMGYKVHGIDTSIVGLDQLKERLEYHQLNITLECRDIYDEDICLDFDIILLDSMLHFYKNDIEKEKKFLTRILKGSKENTVIAIFIQKGNQREKILKEIVRDSISFQTLVDKYINYESHKNTQYNMYIVRKNKDKK